MKKLQQYTFILVRDDGVNVVAGKIFDGFIIALIIANTVFIALDSLTMPPWYVPIALVAEYVFTLVFTLEYAMRIWIAPLYKPTVPAYKARLQYVFSFMALIDLVSIVPFYIPFVIPVDLRILRTLRIVRLLRVFKINRYTDSLSDIARVFRRKASQLLSSFFVVSLLLIVASVIMSNVENAAQPDKFENAFSGLWWAVATITTVGYGDIYPITPFGKVLSAIIAILGIAIVAVPSGIISAGFVEEMEEKRSDSSHSLYSTADEIAKFKALLDNGAITAEEYETQKKHLLAKE